MRYAPRKYDPALIEALAINGALQARPRQGRARPRRVARVARMARCGRSRGELVGRGRRGRRISSQAAVARRDRRPHHRSRASSYRPRHASSMRSRKSRPRLTPGLRRCARSRRALQVEGAEPEPIEGGEADEAEPAEADTKGKPVPVTRPSELLDAVLAAGRKGLSASSATRGWAR